MGVYTEQWHQGKRSRRGKPVPYEAVPVVVVTPDSIDAFLGATSARQRTAFLRGQRDLGNLIHDEGRLTTRVRPALRRPGLERVYVFRFARPEDVPRCRRRRRSGKGRARVLLA